MKKINMHVEFELDETSLESIKTYCLLKSIETDLEEMKKRTYRGFYSILSRDYFIEHISYRKRFFESFHKDEEKINDKSIIEVYAELESMIMRAR